MGGGRVIRAIWIETALEFLVRDGQFIEGNIASARQRAVRMRRNGKSKDSKKAGKMFHNQCEAAGTEVFPPAFLESAEGSGLPAMSPMVGADVLADMISNP